jgi:hypothetical protein
MSLYGIPEHGNILIGAGPIIGTIEKKLKVLVLMD